MEVSEEFIFGAFKLGRNKTILAKYMSVPKYEPFL